MEFSSTPVGTRFIATVMFALCLASSLPRAGAQDEKDARGPSMPAASDPQTDEAEAKRKLDCVLQEAHDDAVFWHYSWVTFFSGALLLQGGMIALAPQGEETRPALAVGLAPPAIGLALQFIRALDALSLEDDLAMIRALPPEAREGAKRALLERYAESEALQRNWFGHVGPIVFNGGVAALLYWGFDNIQLALTQLGVGIAVSQVRLWTSPTVATDALEASAERQAHAGFSLTPVVGAGYFGVAGTF